MPDQTDTEWMTYATIANRWSDVKPIGDGRYAALVQQPFTTTIIVGKLHDDFSWEQEWSFHDTWVALDAWTAWDGTGDPAGWIRHKPSNRRVSDGTGYDQDGNLIPAGQEYIRP